MVLSRHVKFLHDLFELVAQLGVILIKTLDLCRLLFGQEVQILGLILALSKDTLPSELDGFALFFALDDLKVQVIILLDEPLIFFLEGDQSLRVESGFLAQDCVFIL